MPLVEEALQKIGSVRDSAAYREMVEWAHNTDYGLWPQQSRKWLRPAMWIVMEHAGSPSAALAVAREVLPLTRPRTCAGINARTLWLSVVMSGATIEAHVDPQPEDYWMYRVHVPIVTNPNAYTTMMDDTGVASTVMEAGGVYLMDPRVRHEVRNLGTTPRLHLLFDVVHATHGHAHIASPGVGMVEDADVVHVDPCTCVAAAR